MALHWLPETLPHPVETAGAFDVLDAQPPISVVLRVVSSEISGGIVPEISGKITVLFRNNSAEKRTCQTPSYFRTMSTF